MMHQVGFITKKFVHVVGLVWWIRTPCICNYR